MPAMARYGANGAESPRFCAIFSFVYMHSAVIQVISLSSHVFWRRISEILLRKVDSGILNTLLS